jgi:arginyl-tRNA--protein-N-Asp/Glu arginylyltransferase
VTEFSLSKSQKNTLKKFQKYLSKPSPSHLSSPSPSVSASSSPPSGSTTTESSISYQPTPPPSSSSTLSASTSFTVETVPAEFTTERFELYRLYQTAVHHDPPDKITTEGFTNFLVDSPLLPHARPMSPQDTALPFLPTPAHFIPEDATCTSTSTTITSTAREYSGTYHQLYRLNGELIAVSVLDLLPSGVSSVYCFYSPNFRHLELGKFTALYEIAYCRHVLHLPFYYMGFYIHTCQKMCYKGEYQPSQLLCPVTRVWVRLDDERETIKQSLTRYQGFLPLERGVRERYMRERDEAAAAAVAAGDMTGTGSAAELAMTSHPSVMSTSAGGGLGEDSTARKATRVAVCLNYPPVVDDPLAIDPRRCQFSLGPYNPSGPASRNRLLQSDHLTKEGKEIVEKILREFLELSEQWFGEKVIFLFN